MSGNWVHPAFSQLRTRQYAVSGDMAIKKTVASLVGLIGLAYVTAQAIVVHAVEKHGAVHAIIWLMRGILISSLIEGLWAIYKGSSRKVYTDDLPLTPSQRRLLGLDPSDREYKGRVFTPPRYSVSTPRSRSSLGSVSPASIRASPLATPTSPVRM